jgi:periplasmic divalent cation tolerance protein
MKLITVTTTVAQQADAQRIARAIVERHLAACAQICIIESIYHWDGAMQNEAEWRIDFKTTAEHYPAIETAIRELHPYELPAIHAVAVEAVYEPFATWVLEGVAGPPGSDVPDG